MMKILFFALFSLLLGCTSDVDKAKKLGFSTPEQMKYLQNLNFKSYNDFIAEHPFQVDSTSLKFAGAALGMDPNYLGSIGKSHSGFHDVQWLISEGVFVYVDKSNLISVILNNCSEDMRFTSRSKNGNTSIGSLNCSSSKEDISKIKVSSKEFCHVEDFLKGDRYYFKDNLVFLFGKDQEVKYFGLTKSAYNFFNGATEYYATCDSVARTFADSRNGNFDNVYDFLAAKKQGYLTKLSWEKKQFQDRLLAKYKRINGQLEKLLIPLVSSRDEYMFYRNNGGSSSDNSWNGYDVIDMEIGHSRATSKLSFFRIYVDFDQFGTKKPLTVDNLKSALIIECGSKWKAFFDGTTFYNDNSFATCEIIEASVGGYRVTVGIKGD